MTGDIMPGFEIPGAVTFQEGLGGLPKMVLRHADGDGAEVYLHGAHITSWTDSGRNELLFVSSKSSFAPGTPIRGGIPVIFPQFCDGPLPKHGFARVSNWHPVSSRLLADGTVAVELGLRESPETLTIWPHPFRLILGIGLGHGSLTVSLSIKNTGKDPFLFQTALHTYFRVEDIRKTSVQGLCGITYIDSLDGDARKPETQPEITFAEEVDRIYPSAPDKILIYDGSSGRTMQVAKSGMPDVVVWNPWVEKSRRLSDLGDDEYKYFVCVETGIMAEPRALPASKEWHGETVFSSK
jgi:glucose-6-phosphate 1-epimerase